MGKEIERSSFNDEDRREFTARLREETAILQGWFDDRAFDTQPYCMAGLELEGWLIDETYMPAAQNAAFLNTVQDPDLTTELAKYNFEINAPPHVLKDAVFSDTFKTLSAKWHACHTAGTSLGVCPVFIGILPTVQAEMLQLPSMSDSHRYEALNQEVLFRRSREPMHIRIEGFDTLDHRCETIMLEAACTSLQAHLKFNQDDAVRFYNAAIIAAAPLVAATANSPFLYGCSLWAETRVPAVEQVLLMEGFEDAEGRNVGRVTLGTDYLRHSFLELFLENLSYPALLPVREESAKGLGHLRLQNGTIWRWVRPILGFESDGTPHLRLEHRVMPAGPSLIDTVANLALCHGLVLALGRLAVAPETEIPFEDARDNFYACARNGLAAQVRWKGQDVPVRTLLLEELLPAAEAALVREGVHSAEVEHMVAGILRPRLESGRTGAAWQRAFMDTPGATFQSLTERYVALQASGAPVHEWSI